MEKNSKRMKKIYCRSITAILAILFGVFYSTGVFVGAVVTVPLIALVVGFDLTMNLKRGNINGKR